MRDLIVSVAIVAVLVVSWLFFDSYSDKVVSFRLIDHKK